MIIKIYLFFFDLYAGKLAQFYAIVDGEVPVGFTIWFDFGENYIYLMYLSIVSQYQGQKYGTKTERLIFDKVLKSKIFLAE